MDKDLLYEIIAKIGGEEAVKLAKELQVKKQATEDDLSKATGIKLNDVRKILFRLNCFSLAASESIQDEKTGWMIFYWKLQAERLDSIIRTQKRKILDRLQTRLEFEKNHDFYICKNNNCGKFPFEEVVESIFRCPKCGGELDHFDNSEVIATLESKLAALQEEVKSE
jgi:transcription initiation factor TFIIE subunit alpha